MLKHWLIYFIALLLLCFNSFGQAPAISYPSPIYNYTVNTSITPLTPTNNGGGVPATVYGTVSTFTGSGLSGSADGSAGTASFKGPMAVAVDAANNVYVADGYNSTIRKVTPAGVVSTFAGKAGMQGYQDGNSAAARFSGPNGLVFDAAGNLLVSENQNERIRSIDPLGNVRTYLGNGNIGMNNGPGASATFKYPWGIALSRSGNLFIADYNNNVIRKYGPGDVVSTLAGNGNRDFINATGTAASFRNPIGVAVDANDNVYVTDIFNNMIRKITPAGVVTTLAGNLNPATQDGTGDAAGFRFPNGITIDGTGNLYVVDNNKLIRRVTPGGLVTTIAGNPAGTTSQDGVGKDASFVYAVALALDHSGNLYIADENGNNIRKMIATGYTIDKPLPAGLTFDITTGKISGTPTAITPAADYTINAFNKDGSSSTTIKIAVNDVGAPAIAIPHISYVTPQVYKQYNTITPLTPTNTGGSANSSPYNYGQVITFAGGNTLQPSGIVTGADGTLFITGYGGGGGLGGNAGVVQKLVISGGLTNIVSITQPFGVTLDDQHNLYVTSFSENNIYKVVPQTSIKTVFAGSGSAGDVNGTGTAASFNGPAGITIDAAGNLYVADQANNRIKKITPGGVVSTFAGSGFPGLINGTGAVASFNHPSGLAIDALGNIYVADSQNNAIRKITPGGVVTTFAGSGVAGNSDGVGAAASFNNPTGVTIDVSGFIMVADHDNNLIRKIGTGGVVTTLAGSGQAGNADNVIARQATFNGPLSLTFDPPGDALYITDFNNGRIRKIILTGFSIDKPLPDGMTFDTQDGTIKGTPTVPSPPTDYTITAYNGAGSYSTTVNIEVTAAPMCTPTALTILPFDNVPLDANNNFTPPTTTANQTTPVIFTSDNPDVATVVAGGTMIHLTGHAGKTNITASQTGSSTYCDVTTSPSVLTVTVAQYIYFPPIANKTVCSNDFSANATSDSDSGMPITYSSNNPAVATITATGIIHIAGPGTVTITAQQAGTPDGGYIADTKSQTFTVVPPVNPTININPDFISSCDGLAVTYTAVTTNAGTNPTYQWKVNSVPAGTNSATFTSSVLKTDDKITCTVTNTTDCSTAPTAQSNIASLAADPYVTPAVSIQSSASGPVCSGTEITFIATPTNGGTSPGYQWMINGTKTGPDSNTFTTSSLNNGDVITCMLTNQGGKCLTTLFAYSNSISAEVTANQIPTITISASANNIYAGVPVTFTATTTTTGTGAGYQWHINGADVGTNSPTFTSSTLTNNDAISCTISGGTGCFAPATSLPVIMIVTLPSSIPIPNTFTPNGDGTNDIWNIPALASYPACLVNIYNRYGALVYQSRGYSQPWDGSMNGKMLPVATYYYVIDLNAGQPKLSGSVTIIR